MSRVLCILVILAALAVPAAAQSNTANITEAGATCATTNACVSMVLPDNAASVSITLSGTWTATVQFEATNDGTNWVSVAGQPQPSGATASSATANGTWVAPVAGFSSARVRASAFTAGPITATIRASLATPAGSATLSGTASTNLAQVAGNTTLVGNGVTGTGSQRVTIASDNTAFSVNNTQVGTASQNIAQVAGTATVTGGVAGSMGVGGLAADGAAAAGNPNVVAGIDSGGLAQSLLVSNAGQLAAAVSSGADGLANTSGVAFSVANNGTALLAQGGGYVFNGTTWDRARSGATGNLPNLIGSQLVAAVAVDPCQSSGIAKSSVVLNVTTSAQIIAASGSTVIYVCGWSATVGGTAPTYKFHYGTGSVCATGSTDLSGVFLPTVGEFNVYAPGMTAFKSAASAALCVTTGGTTPSVQGVLTYVQQ